MHRSLFAKFEHEHVNNNNQKDSQFTVMELDQTSGVDTYLVRQLIANTMVGNTPQVTKMSVSGGVGCAGGFKGLQSVLGPSVPDVGIVLSTGKVDDLIPSSTMTNTDLGYAMDTPGDASIDSILSNLGGTATISFDACVLEMSFQCPFAGQAQVELSYVFVSNESPMSSSSSASSSSSQSDNNDMFAAWFNNENIATISGQPVCVDTLLSSWHDTASSLKPVLHMAHYTDTLLARGESATLGVTHSLKLVIADVGDEFTDSAVLIGNAAVTCNNPRLEPASIPQSTATATNPPSFNHMETFLMTTPASNSSKGSSSSSSSSSSTADSASTKDLIPTNSSSSSTLPSFNLVNATGSEDLSTPTTTATTNAPILNDMETFPMTTASSSSTSSSSSLSSLTSSSSNLANTASPAHNLSMTATNAPILNDMETFPLTTTGSSSSSSSSLTLDTFHTNETVPPTSSVTTTTTTTATASTDHNSTVMGALNCTISCDTNNVDKKAFCILVDGTSTSVCVTTDKLIQYQLESYSSCGCCHPSNESYHPMFCSS